MSTLNASLASALSGLIAEQGAMATTTNNVANVNTPGYSRQVAELVSSDPTVLGRLSYGAGVTLQSIQSIRDPILEAQIQQQSQAQGQFSSLTSALQQTQTYFTTSTSDIGTSISNFFDSINQLATSPSDLSLRQGVLTAAGNLASSFNSTADNLTQQQNSLDLSVLSQVSQINQLTRQIAQLNTQVSNLLNVDQNAGSFVDQRQQAIDQLSTLVDVTVIPTSGNTLTLTTANGALLVAGQQSFQLQTQVTASGLHDVYSQGQDITGQITSGNLGGTLQARDQEIPAIQTQLNTLATGLANSVNGVQVSGFDRNGNVGTDLFTPPSSTAAAANLSVAVTDPSLIAASSDGSAGSNGNAQALYALSTQAIVAGQTPSDYYSGIVFNVGNAASTAAAEQTASGLVLQQLNDQRGAVSGVSLDEEAANLVSFQNAYSASAQVITAINDMLYATIQMSTLTG
jgi:flagellar hook-associated protein 1 FlgK